MQFLDKYANNGWIKGMRDGIPIAVGSGYSKIGQNQLLEI